MRKPTVYQDAESKVNSPKAEALDETPVGGHFRSKLVDRQILDGRYVLTAENHVQFEFSNYDKSRPLVIDPVLVYSTYLGGNGTDAGNGIAVGNNGEAYLTGRTTSTDFPLDAVQPTYHGGTDAFVAKVNAEGSALVYSTYLGGSGDDEGQAAAVDSAGNAYVTGFTLSTDFPTAAPLQRANGGSADIFVTKLNANGSALVYSTYLGGSGYDQGNGIAVDRSGNAYVTGLTDSTNLPTVKPYQATNRAGASGTAFVAKINAGGSALVYSTYLGGTTTDEAFGIAVDGAGDAYVTGSTASTNFPTVNPFQATNQANSLFSGTNAFVTKLNAMGSDLIYSTYLGGFAGANGSDAGAAIAVDGSGNAYITGAAASSNFPTVNALQPSNHCAGDPSTNVFVSKFNVTGSALLYSTYLGGSGGAFGCDFGKGISVDSSGNAYLTGMTRSSNFPTTANAPQTTVTPGPQGVQTAFVTEFNAAGSALVYSTYLGGSGGDSGNAIAVDTSGNAYVTGGTGSTNFPTADPFQSTLQGASNAFVTKVSPATEPGEPDLAISDSAAGSGASGSLLTYTIYVANHGTGPASGLSIQDAIPSGSTFHSVSVTAGSCTAPRPGGTGTVNCTVPNLAPGGIITETLVVLVTAVSGSTITDKVTATYTGSGAGISANATTKVVRKNSRVDHGVNFDRYR